MDKEIDYSWKLGEKGFFVHNGKVHELPFKKITITEEGTELMFMLKSDINCWEIEILILDSELVFRTKQELLDSL